MKIGASQLVHARPRFSPLKSCPQGPIIFVMHGSGLHTVRGRQGRHFCVE